MTDPLARIPAERNPMNNDLITSLAALADGLEQISAGLEAAARQLHAILDGYEPRVEALRRGIEPWSHADEE